MGVESRAKFLVMGAMLLAVLAGLSGFRRIPVTAYEAQGVVVKLPFGNGIDTAGRAIGIDGRMYGPLTFAANTHMVVVADSYHERLLIFRHGHMSELPATGKMIEDIAISANNQIVAADNRQLTVWSFERHKIRPIVQFSGPKGYTDALWHIALAPRQRILVERLRFGHGTFQARIDEYSMKGQLIRSLAEARAGRNGALNPLGASDIALPVQNLQVAPDGHLYLEPMPLTGSSRTVRIYQQDGMLLGQLIIQSPETILRSDFLGVDARGRVYMVINMDVPHKARVLVAEPDGHLVADIPVPAVSVYAANYGRVLPSGEFYLDDSTSSTYRIRAYRPVTRRVWHWVGF